MITIEREPLTAALSAACRIATNKAYQELRLTAAGGFLSITATDGEHWLDLSVPCSGDMEAVCVHAGRFRDVVANLIGELSGLQIEGGALKIFAGKGKRSLSTMSAKSFPERGEDGDLRVTVDAEKLRDAFAFTLPHIASPEEVSKAYLAGVHLCADEGRLKAIGTDSHNLAIVEICDFKGDLAATIPPKAVSTVMALATGPVDITSTSRAIEFRWAAGKMAGPKLQDDYPLHIIKRAFTDRPPASFDVESKDLLAAVRSVKPVGYHDSISRSTAVKLTLNGSATLSTVAPEGSAEQEFSADLEKAGEIEVGFASGRMERILNGFGDAVLTIGLADAVTPLRFDAAARTDRFALLFPMRV